MSSQVEDVKRLLTAAVACKTQLQASKLLLQEASGVARKLDLPTDQAIGIVRARIGYFAGYLLRPEGQRIFKLFKTAHPVYGRVPAENFDPVGDSFAIGEFMESLGH